MDAVSDPTERVVRAACPHDCPDTCALLVTVRDGRAVKVAGDPDHPSTHGALCTKVARYAERTYAPDRLLTPMRRVGRKGEGRFEPASWDEALADIATRLKEIAARDPQRILPYSYAGTMGWVQGEGMASRFFHRLGASLLERLRSGEAVDWSAVTDDQLQPVYTLEPDDRARLQLLAAVEGRTELRVELGQGHAVDRRCIHGPHQGLAVTWKCQKPIHETGVESARRRHHLHQEPPEVGHV